MNGLNDQDWYYLTASAKANLGNMGYGQWGLQQAQMLQSQMLQQMPSRPPGPMPPVQQLLSESAWKPAVVACSYCKGHRKDKDGSCWGCGAR